MEQGRGSRSGMEHSPSVQAQGQHCQRFHGSCLPTLPAILISHHVREGSLQRQLQNHHLPLLLVRKQSPVVRGHHLPADPGLACKQSTRVTGCGCLGTDCRSDGLRLPGPPQSLAPGTCVLVSSGGQPGAAPAALVQAEKVWDLTRICLAAQDAGGHGVLPRVDQCKDASQGPLHF